MTIKHLPRLAEAIASGILITFAAPSFSAPNDGVEGLNAEQQAFAARVFEFMDDMDEKFFGLSKKINGGEQTDESEYMEFDHGDWDVRVARGDTVEKMGRMISRIYDATFGLQPDRLQELGLGPTDFDRYYGIDIHAESPLMGLMHAAFSMQYYTDGTSALGGTVNIMRGGAQQDDLDYVQQAVDAVFEKYGRDPKPNRDRVCTLSETREKPELHRKVACVGVSFFGFPLMEATEENFGFITEVYETFIATYLETLDGRKGAAYTDEDIALQDAMRKNWLEDQAFSDPYSSGGIITPYEVWGRAFMPPEVKF